MKQFQIFLMIGDKKGFMDCKKTIYYNLETKKFYDVAKYLGFDTIDEFM